MIGSLKPHTFMNHAQPRKSVFTWLFLEVKYLESKKNVPAPEMTSEGKFKCRADKQEYDTREDYEAHCMEEHPGGM